MKCFSNYLGWFNLKKSFLILYAIDCLAFGAIYFFWLFLGKVIESRMLAVTGGKSVEELNAALLSSSLESSQAILGNVKVFVLVFFVGIILGLAFTLFALASSQQVTWSRILKKAFSWKAVLRWCFFLMAVLLLLCPYLLLYVALRLLLGSILSSASYSLVYPIAIGIFSSITLVIFFLWSILAFHYFAEKTKVWESIGASFFWIRKNIKKFWCFVLYGTVTFIIFNLIFSIAGQKLIASSSLVSPVKADLLGFALLLLFYGWLRSNVAKAVHADAE